MGGFRCGALAALLSSLVTAGSAIPLVKEPVRVRMDTREADAALAILERERANRPVGEREWERLFATEGFRRLSAREAAMKRSFSRESFQAFLESAETRGRAVELSETLARWKSVDVGAAARRALAYLPEGARIEATVFPVIKPARNSFVFSEPEPSIFLALDPTVAPNKLANTLAHELHHIGFATACPPADVRAARENLPEEKRRALEWLTAFGEGFAMLAAAGGVEIHPHATSPPEDRARWDRDMRNVDRDLETLDRFFRDILEKRLTKEQSDERGFGFFGVQGPWYTVGYHMATTIERAFGRTEMIRCFCDAALLPDAYNRAADARNLAGARWSEEVRAALDVRR